MRQRPTPPLNEDFPAPLARFLESLIGTPDEVWSRLLILEHNGQNMKPQEWRTVLGEMKASPVESKFVH